MTAERSEINTMPQKIEVERVREELGRTVADAQRETAVERDRRHLLEEQIAASRRETVAERARADREADRATAAESAAAALRSKINEALDAQHKAEREADRIRAVNGDLHRKLRDLGGDL